MDVEPEHVGSTVKEAMQTLKAVKVAYAPGPDCSPEEKEGYQEIDNYLSTYKKTMMGIMYFCSHTTKQSSESEEREEEEEGEYEEVQPTEDK